MGGYFRSDKSLFNILEEFVSDEEDVGTHQLVFLVVVLLG